jgi:hypothetical protein
VLVIDLRSEDSPPPPQRSDTAPTPAAVTPTSRRGSRRWLGALLLLVILLAAAYGVGRWALSNSYYVGVDDSDRVTIYQGIPERIAGLTLAEEVEPSSLSLDELPQNRRASLRAGMKVDSLADAQSTIANLSDLAREFKKERGDSTA